MTAQINFYHSRFRRKHLLLPFSRMLMITILASLSIPAMIAINNLELHKIKAQANQLQQEYNRMGAEWAKAQNTLVQKNPDPTLAAEVTKLNVILAHRAHLTQMIRNNRFEHNKGYSDYLIALARQHIANIWLTKIKITKNGTSLSLEGKTNNATTLPDYLQRLANEPILVGTQLETLRIKQDTKDHSSRSPLLFLVASTAG